MYKVTGYRDGYAEEQASLDIEVSKTWVMPDSTPVEKLAEHYRSLDVDPRLRHYCFQDGKMIGFASSRLVEPTHDGLKRVKMDFPVVLPGHEDAIDILYEKSVDAFHKMGVGVIESTFGLWGGSGEWAGKWGFKKVNEMGVLYGLDVDSWSPVETDDVTEFNPEIDLESVVEYFSTQFDLPEDAVREFTMRLYNNENTLGYYVVRGQGKLLASGALGVNPNILSLGALSAVHDEGTEYLATLMNAMAKSAKKNDIDRIFMFFTHLSPGHPLMDKYTSLGFRYLGSNANYMKRL